MQFCARLRDLTTKFGLLLPGIRFLCSDESRKEIKKVLIANRGEIACRIITTARRLGIPTVAVFSSADRKARHVELADEAVFIGQAPASESYLNSEAILSAAKRCGANAIHPGYGFLSEHFKFALECQTASITFIGPPSAVIRSMGDKSEAKQIMRKAGVPVVPGYDGENQEIDFLIEEGMNRVGYPLLVKATVGGGGKGMKLARNNDELKNAIASAQREAQASFGDSRVLLERFIERPRHVEVQVIADSHGNVLHLFERDCSVQRRHQKILEESPAPEITTDFKEAVCASAVSAAKAVGYVNAGTVEFIMDTDTDAYYFMEMNTRLQVEHPVTEGVTGLDLVELQFHVAAGGQLNIKQKAVQQTGHCIEARLYAESPHQGFLPGAGKVERWHIPLASAEFSNAKENEDVRVDSGIRKGDEIGVHYDPMIAKIICNGHNREQAINKLHNALSQIQVCGMPTNVEFLKHVLDHQSFRTGEIDTSFIAKYEQELFKERIVERDSLALAAAIRGESMQMNSSQQKGLFGPWQTTGYKRLNYNCTQTLTFETAEKQQHAVSLTYTPNGQILFNHAAGTVTVKHVQLKQDRFEAEVNGVLLRGHFCLFKRSDVVGISVWAENGSTCTVYTTLKHFSAAKDEVHHSRSVTAPMHGTVVKVMVSANESIKKGDTLLILEAMKMEHEIKAKADGIVESVSVSQGSKVHDGQTLILLQPDA